jgi:hypothetical protein
VGSAPEGHLSISKTPLKGNQRNKPRDFPNSLDIFISV